MSLIVPGKASPFSYARDFLQNKYVYLTISSRARGLSVGINLNPDKECNFDCTYCEVDRTVRPGAERLDLELLTQELTSTLNQIQTGELQTHPPYKNLPDHLLQLRHVALSGDGEPTLSDQFLDVVHTVLHVRALGMVRFFKVVLITNCSGLDCPSVQEALSLFTSYDEVWAKLDAGTDHYMSKVNRANVPLAKIIENILLVARQRPVIIQSLFTAVHGEEPPDEEIEGYVRRLLELKEAGAKIKGVQIYSANRPQWRQECEHLPLKRLSRIAQRVREGTGLKAEVF